MTVFNAAKMSGSTGEAVVSPRSLVSVSLRTLGQAPELWFDQTRKRTLSLEQRWFTGSIPVEIVDVTRFPQFTAIIPDNLEPQPAILVLRIDDAVVASTPIRIVSTDPGIFTSGGGNPCRCNTQDRRQVCGEWTRSICGSRRTRPFRKAATFR